MYAAMSRRQLSPVSLIVQHWMTMPQILGNISCTSLVTRIARHLGLLENASVSYRREERPIIGFDFFSKGHILKKRGSVYYAMHTTIGEIRLPNPDLSIYRVQSYLLNVQAQPINMQRAMPTRHATTHEPAWTSADPNPQEPAFAAYQQWTYPPPSQAHYCQNEQSPQSSREGPSEHGDDARIRRDTYRGSGYFHDIPGTSHHEQSHNFEPGRSSFAGFGQQEAHYLHGIYTTMQEMRHDQTTFYQDQRNWNEQTSQRINDLQDTLDMQADQINTITGSRRRGRRR